MLPTHRSGGGSSRTSPGLKSAFDKGLGLAGLKATKTGHNEKERAFIIRQNWALKAVIFLVVLFTVILVLLFSTVLEVSVTRRAAIKSVQMFHESEYKTQWQLIRAHQDLVKALEVEVHETTRLEELRTGVDMLIGNHENQLTSLLNEVTIQPEQKLKIAASNEQLRSSIQAGINEILNHFNQSLSSARSNLKRVSKLIVEDIASRSKEDDMFVDTLKAKFGIDLDDIHEYNADLDTSTKNESDESDKTIILKRLERFFKRLRDDEFPLVDQAEIDSWVNELENIMTILDDDTEDVNFENLKKSIKLKVAKLGSKVDPFDPAKHSSIIDYYAWLIERAKIANHKQELLDLYSGWKQGSLDPLTAMANIFTIADERNLHLVYEWFYKIDVRED